VLRKFGEVMPLEDRDWWLEFGRAIACVRQPTPTTAPKVATKKRVV